MTDSGQVTSVREPSFCRRSTVPLEEGWQFVDMTMTSFLSIRADDAIDPRCTVNDSPLEIKGISIMLLI